MDPAFAETVSEILSVFGNDHQPERHLTVDGRGGHGGQRIKGASTENGIHHSVVRRPTKKKGGSPRH